MSREQKPFTPEERASYRGWRFGSTLDWSSRILVALDYPVTENRWYVDAVQGICQALKKRFPDGVPISHSSLAKRAERFKNKAQASELSRSARERHLEHARLKRVMIFDVEVPKPRERKGKDKRAQTKYTDYLTPAAVWAQDCEKRVKDADPEAWKSPKYRGEKRAEIPAEAIKMLPSFEGAAEEELPAQMREERCGACEAEAKHNGDDSPRYKKDCPGHPQTLDEYVEAQQARELAARKRIVDKLAGEHLTDEEEIDERLAALDVYYARSKKQLEKDYASARAVLLGMRSTRLVTPVRFTDPEQVAAGVNEKLGTEAGKTGPARRLQDDLFVHTRGKVGLTPSVQYVSGTEKQAKEHVAAIKGRLESSAVAAYYPALSKPEIGAHGAQRGWRQDYLATQSGWGIVPVGLDQGIRGGRKDDTRYSLIILDDVDDIDDSRAVVEKKLNTISRTILPAGDSRTIVIFAQNLIHEDSVLNQIYTRRSDVLSDRMEFGPYKSFEDVKLDPHPTVPGKFVIRDGAVPTWPHLNIEDARLFLSRSGRHGFMAEYQHDFERDASEYVLPHWDDERNVITRSQFRAVFGTERTPWHWPKRWFNDWAKTKSARHANVAGSMTVSAQNTRLPGVTFVFDCLTFEANTPADDVALGILQTISPTVNVSGKAKTWEEVIRDCRTRQNMAAYSPHVADILSAERDSRSKIIPALVKPVISGRKIAFRGSHEQANDAHRVMRDVYGLQFKATNPGHEGGIEFLNSLMYADRSVPHPFKPDERGEDGLYRLGRPNFFLVVDDDKAAKPAGNNPAALRGSDLARYQLPRWRLVPAKLSETGEVVRGPMKMLDDFGNGFQMCVYDGPIPAPQLTADERFWVEHPDCHPDRVAEDIAAGRRSPNAWHAAAVTRREHDEQKGRGTFASGVAARRYGKGGGHFSGTAARWHGDQ